MELGFSVLWQAVCEAYTALAADIPLVIQAAQAALPLLRGILEYIKK